MSLRVIFLGTAGSVPTTQRGLPSIATQRKGELILFDCGEGTQRQMIQAGIGFHRKTRVFITHMHARLLQKRETSGHFQKVGENKIRERQRALFITC